ncbi:hypothetical protein H5410_047964, partial [Solanum commersonii]
CGNVACTESKLEWMLLLLPLFLFVALYFNFRNLHVLAEQRKGKKLKRCDAWNIEPNSKNLIIIRVSRLRRPRKYQVSNLDSRLAVQGVMSVEVRSLGASVPIAG